MDYPENDKVDKHDDNVLENSRKSSTYYISTVVHSGHTLSLSPLSRLSKDESIKRWSALKPFEKIVFKGYSEGMTLNQLATKFSTSQSTISRALQ